MNLTLFLIGILIGIFITFNMKVSYHGVNSNWYIKTFPNIERKILSCKNDQIYISKKLN